MSRFFGKKKGAATDDDDAARSNLFGNRTAQNPPSNPNGGGNPYAQQGSYNPGYGGAPPADSGSRGGGGYGGSYAAQNPYAPHNGGDDGRSREDYGGYGYNSEEEDVEAVKSSIKFTKDQSVRSTRNALNAAQSAEESGLRILNNLSTQGARLHNTEKNLDVASSQNRVAEDKARELKNLNRSMFVPNVGNPLRSKSRAEAEEAKIIARHQAEREERDRTREFGYESKNVVGRALNTTTGRVESKGKSSLAERSRYQFEADSEDDALEDEIDSNLDQLGAITGRLKGMAMATSKEVDRQNQQIDKIMKKSDRVDDQIALNHNRIRKIH
ncbi:hypothetical protein B9Z19DRAFT_1099613 [Tuber borchii]|uniref:t-SNARE coiled-coil homology domain-containing protein n=1 Tax=Tuber borchii TaxID=42251 RepID=A0A2T7A1R7_TUBBO|nr:hypothetical protein B9Z19DRAFT_1099613 [Tuber borchii]